MRKYIYIVLLFLLCSGRASAQFTLVSGTVTDANASPYSQGVITISLSTPLGTSGAYLNGAQISGTAGPIQLDNNGAFTVQLADNTQIKCGNTQGQIVTCTPQTKWTFNITFSPGVAPPVGTGPQTCSTTTTISGSSQTLTLNTCPRITTVGGGLTGGPVNQVLGTPVQASGTTTYGITQFVFNHVIPNVGSTATTVGVFNSQPGDTIVVGMRINGTISGASDACGNSYISIANISIGGNALAMFYAANVVACNANIVTIAHSNAAFQDAVVWNLRGVSIAPLDQSASGTAASASGASSSAITTTQANEIVIALAQNGAGGSYTAANALVFAGNNMTVDYNGTGASFNATGAGNTSITSIQSGVVATSNSSVGATSQSIIVATFKQAIPAPSTLTAGIPLVRPLGFGDLPTNGNYIYAAAYGTKQDALVAIGATWANSGSQITTSSTLDPPFACPGSVYPCSTAGPGSDIGKALVGSSACVTTDGDILCSTVLPQGTITSIQSAHVATYSGVANAANTAPDASGFTGWVVWCSDDTVQLQNSWQDTLKTPGGLLVLPSGRMCVSAEPFGPPITALIQQVANGGITGATQNASSSVIIPLADKFNYNATTNGLIFGPGNLNKLIGVNAQNAFPWGKLSNFTVWAYGQSASSLDPLTLPIMSLQNVYAENVYLAGWQRTAPAWNLSGAHLTNCLTWSAGNPSLNVVGEGPVTGNANLIAGGAFIQFGMLIAGPVHTRGMQSIGGANPGVTVNAGAIWDSVGDEINGITVNGGTVNFSHLCEGSGGLGNCVTGGGVNGLTITGGTVVASDSFIFGLIQSGGTFFDKGGVFRQGTNNSYTTSPVNSITGGTIIGANSVTGTAITAAKLVLSAGWGSTAAWTSLSGFTRQIQGTITASGVGQAANPTITYTFPTPFATVANVVCEGHQVGGTQPILAATEFLTPSALTVTGITLTYNGTPTAGDTLVVQINCDSK